MKYPGYIAPEFFPGSMALILFNPLSDIMIRKILILAILFAISYKGLAQEHYAKGLIIDPDTYKSVPRKASLLRGNYEQLPDWFSLKKFCPRPGNQIQLNTSPGWAASYGARTILEAESRGDTITRSITVNSFSPVFNYLISTGNENRKCKVPTTLTGVLESMKKSGTPKYINFEGFCPDSIPEHVYELAERNNIDGYARLFDTNDAPEFKLNAVKKSLAQGIPVIIGMYCPPSFGSAREFWQPREKVSHNFEPQALCVIGYDDSKYSEQLGK